MNSWEYCILCCNLFCPKLKMWTFLQEQIKKMIFTPHSCEVYDLLLWCRCDGLISCQCCLQVNNIGLFFCQLSVPLCQHGIHFLAPLPLWLDLLPLEEISYQLFIREIKTDFKACLLLTPGKIRAVHHSQLNLKIHATIEKGRLKK